MKDPSRLQNIWFFDLSDLDTENAEVEDMLHSWIKFMVKRYQLDGLRVDTVRWAL